MPDPNAGYMDPGDPNPRRWGFMLGDTFIPIPKTPCLLEDATRFPPFSIRLTGREEVRHIIYEPEATENA